MSHSLERAMKHFFRVEAWALYLTDEKSELHGVQRRGITPELHVEDLSHKDPFLHSFVVPSGSDQGKTVWILNLPMWRLHERIGFLVLRIPNFAPDQRAVLLAEAGAFGTQLIFAMAKAK